MSNKKFILNADDFGMSNDFNKAVLDGYNSGFLTSASICSNGEAFDAAINEILPECPNLGIGIHLNIIEGKALSCENNSLLVNSRNEFCNGYIKMMYLAQNRTFLEQVEKEFRLQIEKLSKFAKINHIDSHVHTHGIPKIFELTCKLAQEYGIKQIRTQHENFYIIPDIFKHISLKYPPNILKIILLNYFTKINQENVKKYELETNNYLIGVGYTGMMDKNAIYYGLHSLEDKDIVAEALIHPCNCSNPKTNNQHYKEFLITQDKDLQDKIQRLGFEISNYK